jgi:hypothetical protein
MPDPESLDWEGTFGPYRDVWMIFRVVASDVAEAQACEQEHLPRLDQNCSSVEDFDRMCEKLEGRWGDGDERDDRLFGLDYGVAGLVLALNHVGVGTAVSCRGHSGDQAWVGYPLVRCTTDACRLPILFELAGRCNCGVEVESDGLISVWAQSIMDTMSLGGEVLATRSRFDGCGPTVFDEALDRLCDDD